MKLYNVKEAAELIGVKEGTIREWLKSGQLKGVKVGRLWRIKEEQLQEFLKNGDK